MSVSLGDLWLAIALAGVLCWVSQCADSYADQISQLGLL